MAKRKQKEVQRFRGKKQAIKQAAHDWMGGTSGQETVVENQSCMEPTFQVNAPGEDKKPAAEQSQDHMMDEGVATADPYDLMESEEEEEDVTDAQLVTPRSNKRPTPVESSQSPSLDAPTTIIQYQAIIRNYQAQLERAERQIRTISKTSLADKFLENEVRKYVKEGLWKRCKFITCRETMDECMNEVADQFAIDGNKREHWKSTYEHAVRDALNNRRNNTAQDLKKELIGKWDLVWYIEMIQHCTNYMCIYANTIQR